MDKKQEQALYKPKRTAVDDTKIEKYMSHELDPKCLDDRQPSFGLTNRGELIPCCWMDNQVNRHDEDYQKLLAVSKIEDYDSIDEILFTDEWIQFSKNISNGIGFISCHHVCKKRETPQHKRESLYEDGGFDLDDVFGSTSKKVRIREL